MKKSLEIIKQIIILFGFVLPCENYIMKTEGSIYLWKVSFNSKLIRFAFPKRGMWHFKFYRRDIKLISHEISLFYIFSIRFWCYYYAFKFNWKILEHERNFCSKTDSIAKKSSIDLPALRMMIFLKDCNDPWQFQISTAPKCS